MQNGPTNSKQNKAPMFDFATVYGNDTHRPKRPPRTTHACYTFNLHSA
jgi:hypothetical protein